MPPSASRATKKKLKNIERGTTKVFEAIENSGALEAPKSTDLGDQVAEDESEWLKEMRQAYKGGARFCLRSSKLGREFGREKHDEDFSKKYEAVGKKREAISV